MALDGRLGCNTVPAELELGSNVLTDPSDISNVIFPALSWINSVTVVGIIAFFIKFFICK
jgi:hypothetical protein